MPRQHLTRLLLVTGSYLTVIILAFLTANYLVSHPGAGEFLAHIGYPGVFVVAFVAGINLFPPIPAAAITPLLTAAGLHMIPIIAALSLGTIVADSVAYFYGASSRDILIHKYPKIVSGLRTITKKHKNLVPLIIFMFAGLIPLPNELVIIPLSVLGIRWRAMMIPLLLGDVVSQTILALGIQHIFDVWM